MANTPVSLRGAMGGMPFYSGILNTQRTFSHQFGYIEFRASVPGNFVGVGGSLWLLPADGSWPPEIDVNEWGGINGDGINRTHPVAIVDTGEWPPNNSVYNVTDQNFHTWSLDWRANGIDWYQDGVKINGGTSPPGMLSQPMYLILQMNSGQGPPVSDFDNGVINNPGGLPVFMQIDYVRWWINKAARDAAGNNPAVPNESPSGAIL